MSLGRLFPRPTPGLPWAVAVAILTQAAAPLEAVPGTRLRDVPAPDVMTSAQHMLWMLDEYETLAGGHFPGFITGKPVGMGGAMLSTE